MENIPAFRIIPVNKLIAHEHHDGQRTTPLMARLQKSGVLKNPPVVLSINDEEQQYSILDGANRIQALQKIGISHGMVQVVNLRDPGLKLNLWNHVIWNMDAEYLINSLRSIRDLEIVLIRSKRKGISNYVQKRRIIARIQFSNKDEYAAVSDSVDLITKNIQLNAIVDCYINNSSMDRTMISKIKYLKKSYPDFCGIVKMPKFSIFDVIRLSKAGELMPNGCTRFTVSPRALHLNYPLEKLSSSLSLGEKNEELQEWIDIRLTQKRVRYYAESTVLFDE